MELKEITFVSGEGREAVPSTVTVEMSVEEALWCAKIAGKQQGESPHNDIYSCLAGDVFNRYYEDGLVEAGRRFSVEIPPIKYEDNAVKTQTVEEWADEYRDSNMGTKNCPHDNTEIESLGSMPGNKAMWFEVKCSSCGITGPRAASEKDANIGWGLGFRTGYMEDKNNG